MTLEEPTNAAESPARVEVLLHLVESEAESRLARGIPGAWGDVARRSRAAREALSAEPPCDARWHAYFLELEVWGGVLGRVVLPERQDQLLEALRAKAHLETPEDSQAWDALLSVVHPGLRDPALATDSTTFIRIEVRFCRALRAFRAGPTASSLRACLAIALELVHAVERQTAHRRCGPDTYRLGDVIFESLMDLLPLAHRWMLAQAVREWFFRLYGEGEEPGSSGFVPLALWRRLPKGHVVVPVSLRLLDPPRDTEPSDGGPWFVEGIEAHVTPFGEWSWEELMWPWRRPAEPREGEER